MSVDRKRLGGEGGDFSGVEKMSGAGDKGLDVRRGICIAFCFHGGWGFGGALRAGLDGYLHPLKLGIFWNNSITPAGTPFSFSPVP